MTEGSSALPPSTNPSAIPTVTPPASRPVTPPGGLSPAQGTCNKANHTCVPVLIPSAQLGHASPVPASKSQIPPPTDQNHQTNEAYKTNAAKAPKTVAGAESVYADSEINKIDKHMKLLDIALTKVNEENYHTRGNETEMMKNTMTFEEMLGVNENGEGDNHLFSVSRLPGYTMNFEDFREGMIAAAKETIQREINPPGLPRLPLIGDIPILGKDPNAVKFAENNNEHLQNLNNELSKIQPNGKGYDANVRSSIQGTINKMRSGVVGK